MAKAKKSTAKKPRSSKKQKIEHTAPLITFKKIKLFVGYTILLASVFLSVAFISYFFTWKSDQDKVLEFSWKIITGATEGIQNKLGSFGAFFSHLFFYDLFGLASFFVLWFSTTWSINLISAKKFFKTSGILMHCLFLIVFFSTLLAFLLPTAAFPFGGALGLFVNDWLGTVLGKTGLGILLTFVAGLYTYFNFSFGWLKLMKLPKRIQSEASLDDDGFDIITEKGRSIELNNKKSYIEESILPEEIIEVTPHHKDDTFEVLERVQKEVKREEKERTKLTAKKLEPILIDNPELQIEKVKEEKVEGSNGAIQHTQVMGKYDPKLDLPKFKFPPLNLLEEHGNGQINIDKGELEQNKDQIIETLSNYNIKISKIKATVGPTVTLYEIVPAPGVRISKIKNLEDDIALSLAALGIRIIAPIPGKGTIGIEVPNVHKSIVSMKTMLASEKFRNSDMILPIALGKTISNEIYITDLAKMPHLLMAGATGQGKSVGLNAILVSLLYKLHPAELKFVLVDPKKVELTLYKYIEKHYLAKLPGEEESIITDTKKVIHTLNALCIEMDERYDLLKNAQVRNISEYNKKFIDRKLNPQKGHRFLPFIVLVVDEFADLMMTAGKDVEMPIARLAQLARAIGIHLVIATQRPSVNIITGTIKANFPGRMAFKVTSKVDSRTILDASGADQLIGRGDMLLSINGNIVRLQCPFVDTPEVEEITTFINNQKGYSDAFLLPEYVDPKDESNRGEVDLDERDALFEDAARIIVAHQQGSTSLIQRRLKLGYNRAGRLIDQLEAAGIVGPNVGSKAREVYIPDEYELERFLQEMGQEVE